MKNLHICSKTAKSILASFMFVKEFQTFQELTAFFNRIKATYTAKDAWSLTIKCVHEHNKIREITSITTTETTFFNGEPQKLFKMLEVSNDLLKDIMKAMDTDTRDKITFVLSSEITNIEDVFDANMRTYGTFAGAIEWVSKSVNVPYVRYDVLINYQFVGNDNRNDVYVDDLEKNGLLDYLKTNSKHEDKLDNKPDRPAITIWLYQVKVPEKPKESTDNSTKQVFTFGTLQQTKDFLELMDKKMIKDRKIEFELKCTSGVNKNDTVHFIECGYEATVFNLKQRIAQGAKDYAVTLTMITPNSQNTSNSSKPQLKNFVKDPRFPKKEELEEWLVALNKADPNTKYHIPYDVLKKIYSKCSTDQNEEANMIRYIIGSYALIMGSVPNLAEIFQQAVEN